MKNFDMKKINQAGSLMIEAIAMLGLISLVTPVVYKKSAERMTELQDINAASHLRMLSSALDAYISDNYDTLKGDVGEYTLTADKLAKYLPEGAVEEGKVYGPLGEDYIFSYVVKETDNDEKPVITGYVGADVTDDKITPQRTSRIATMIGGNGAIVDNGEVLGVQGTWQAKATDIKFDGINDNSVVVASQNAVGATAQIDTSKFLYRVEDDVENNTMQTNLYMHDGHSSHSIEGVSQLLIGYQMGRGGNQWGAQDVDKQQNSAPAGDYALYVSSNNTGGNTWLGGSLKAAKGRLNVTENEFEYNPYYKKIGNGETYAESGIGAGLVVDSGGLSFSTGANYHDQFKLTDKDLTYSNKLIVAENGAGDTTKQAVRFFGNSDDAKVSIKEDKTLLRNRLVADYNDIYEEDIDAIDDDYRKVGDGVETNFSRSKATTSDFATANVLTGKTYATELETGYLKTEDFDAKNLRAGRSNLENSNETWMLDVEDGVARLGKDNPAKDDGQPSASALYVIDYGNSVQDISNQGRGPGIYMISRFSEKVDKKATIAITPGGLTSDAGDGITMTATDSHINSEVTNGNINSEVTNGNINSEVTNGNINSEVTGGNINMVSNGGEVIISNKKGTTNSDTGTTTYNETAHLNLRGDGNADLQGNEYVFIQTNNNDSQQGNVVLQNGVLAVSDTRNTSHDIDDKVASSNNATAATAGVYIRRGSIVVNTFSYDEKKDGSNRAADAGTGYVKADRFVVENTSDKDGHSRNPSEVYNNGATVTGNGTVYDHYMVDPAYTSVMHDIKLTSRGGARLSDILPDFINKGIYVTDNSYGEGTEPKTSGITSMNDSVEEDDATFASAFLGVVPAPQCPPGYAKVITLTPAGWRMAQIGTLVEDSNSGNRLYLNETTPEYKDKKIIKETEYAVTTNSGSNSVVRIPKIFQQNTWLKSAIKLNTAGKNEDTQTGNQYSNAGDFIGWNTYMGFIYPAVLWNHLFKDKGIEGVEGTDAPQLGQGNNTIYWNLFPVDKWSIEGYATVYCYFDRGGLTNEKPYFNDNMVDTKYNQYSTLRGVSQGATKGKNGDNDDYIKRLNNPKLKYTQEW